MASVEPELLWCSARYLNDSLIPSLKVASGPVGEASCDPKTLLKWSS